MTAKPVGRARDPFVMATQASLAGPCGVKPGQTLVAAVSGGADSVALLLALAAIAEKRRWRLGLVVGHVQHHLRPESEDDARFVQELSLRLGVVWARADIRRPDGSGNVEAWARKARYQALAQMAQIHGAHAVATAHHGDDQLETMLMRLVRGGGLRGMAGMPWSRRIAPGSRVRLIRPMLAMDRNEPRSFLCRMGQPWCEDHTNADITRWRAHLRAQVVPALKVLRPDVASKIAAAAGQFRAAADVLDHLAAELDHRIAGDWHKGRLEVRRQAMVDAMPGVMNTLLRRWLGQAGVPADALPHHRVLELAQAVRTGGETRRFTFRNGVTVQVSRHKVEVVAGDKT